MAVADATVATFQIGRVVTRTFSVIGENIVTFTLLTLLVTVPLMLATLSASQDTLSLLQGNGPGAGGVATMGMTWLLSIVGMYFLQAALVHGTVVSLNGRKASFGECLSTGLSNFFPLFLIALLEMLGLVMGFVLLLVPGLMLLMRWSVAVPARVVEHTGVVESFRRSAELTRGHRWSIFGLAIVLLLLHVVLNWVFGAYSMSFRPGAGSQVIQNFTEALKANLNPVRLLTLMLSQTIYWVVGAAGVASLYYELRTVKEGIGPQALASVFD
jgi:hypothetical protein